MRRFVVLGAGVLVLLIMATAFLGCGGGAAASAIASITLSPSNLSLNRGATAQITAQALDANNNPVAIPTLAFHSSNPAITVSSNGMICAGQWDANFINCQITDNNNNVLPLATVAAPASITATATVNDKTITSSAVVVTDHERIDSLQVCLVDGAGTHCPAPATGCVSQNGSALYVAQAFSNDPQACQRINGSTGTPCQVPNDTIGSVNWQVSPAQVATADATTHTATDPAKLTAAVPGQGVVVGSVGPSGSTVTGSAPFTTCAVANIHVHHQGDTDTSFTAPVGGTVPLVANVKDSLGATLTSTLALTWLTSQPALASVSAGTAQGATVQALAPGTASITAACLPPLCNVNFTPPQAVYGDNVVTANITGTAASTVLATTSTAPASSTSSNAIVPISTTTNSTGTAFTLPANLQVNSMVLTPQGSLAFLGTSCASGTTGPNGAACSGLLRFDPTVSTVAVPVPAITGRVLATDGTSVVLSDPANSHVLIADTALATTPITLNIPNATAAAISIDGSKVYIVAGSKLFIYSAALGRQSIDLSPDTASTSSQGIAFFATGATAYVADLTGNDTVIATCKNAINAILSPVPVGGSPTHIATVPNATAMVDANSPNIDEIDANSNGDCPPVITPTPAMPTSHGFPNVSDFTAKQLIVTPDSKLAIILGDTCTTGTVAACTDASHQGVLVYNLGSKQASVIPLAGGARPISGAVTPDSATLYIGASDGNVHRVDLNSGTDAQSISVALCPSVSGGCNPDFVVVRPVATVATLSSIAVTPANPTISANGPAQNCPAGAANGEICFTATGTFSDKTTRDLTNFVTWTSSNTVVAIIGPNASVTPPLGPGVASALAAGTATISATSGGVSGSTTLTVR
jgi:hypothetical protein